MSTDLNVGEVYQRQRLGRNGNLDVGSDFLIASSQLPYHRNSLVATPCVLEERGLEDDPGSRSYCGLETSESA